MAKIIRCANRHFYDSEKFQECPYCNKEMGNRIEIQRWIMPDDRGQLAGAVYRDSNDKEVTQALEPIETHDRSIRLNDSGSVTQDRIEGLDADDDPVTVGIFRHQHQGNDLVTGWLVCTSGPDKGRDYRIKHGNNWIGRSQNSDIWMNGDADIASEKQCAVVYDGKSNTFFIVPGSGAITYVNGKILNKPKKLETGDSIEFGRSKFEFIPFCREGHVWN